jgi:molybdopterin converting factor small subunit
MTHVTLKFTGEMWARTKVYQTAFSFDGGSLAELLRAVFTRYPVRDLVLNENDQFVFRSGVLVNGRSARYLGGLAATIQNGDEVIVMRPSIGAM